MLSAAAQQLAATSDSARADAEILLAHVLACTRAQLHARNRETLSDLDQQTFEQLVQRRRRQEPVAYLTGEQAFWTLTLKVTPAVLVPRPDTELLVEWGLELLRERPSPRVADLGTGSGCIALALASERPDAQILATDISPEALSVATDNARQMGLGNLSFQCASFSETSGGPFDLLLSNPPYIPASDPHLPALRHEPLSALSDGADGLNCLREIIGVARTQLRPGSWLLLEHGYDQGAAVRQLLNGAGYSEVSTRRDLSGHERASGGLWP